MHPEVIRREAPWSPLSIADCYGNGLHAIYELVARLSLRGVAPVVAFRPGGHTV
jgi:hypothetical protein